jgi:hypothetical protein
MAMDDFQKAFPWHDSILRYIYVDRQNPGENDVVRLKVGWPDEPKSSIFEFYDCYGLEMKMNFGIIAAESILNAEVVTESIELKSIRKIWIEMGISLENLKCYRIITNSTNSIINIYAMGFTIYN